MSRGSPLILIGFDAAEISLIEKLLAAGRMPHLARLRRRGRFSRMQAEDRYLHAAVWRSFLNGVPVEEHGWYFSKQWRPDHGCIEPAAPGWIRQRPFWDTLAETGMKLALVDVPHAPRAPESFPGVILNGWQMHDVGERSAYPRALWGELEERFGPSPLGIEHYGLQTPDSLMAVRDQALATAEQFGEIVSWLLKREAFDLVVAVMGAAHRAGHYLWDLSQIDAEALPAAERDRLEGALADIYAACDRAIGRIVERAPADARFMVFALHGMGPNVGWVERFGEIVQLFNEEAARPSRRRAPDLKRQVRRIVRSPFVLRATKMLPASVNQALTRFWTARMHDWSKTRFFALPAEVEGQVRINLAGRERHGIVPEGRSYDALCEEIADGLLELEDLETGEPVVARVDRVDSLVSPTAPYRDRLPDLSIQWRSRPITASPGVRSRRLGERRWSPLHRLPSGRSGNHTTRGWLLVAGAGVASTDAVATRLAGDIVPSIFREFGVEPPEDIAARPFTPLLEEAFEHAA